MHIFSDIDSIRNHLQALRLSSKTLGLVPTMGALHEGHLRLLDRSLYETDVTICTIFVNPAQFNNPNDLASYPRPRERDLELLEKEGCHIAFMPSDDEMYPGTHDLSIEMPYLDSVLEGQYRPGHFRGVRLVVAKLLNITCPDRAYFGTKDLQQLIVIREMTKVLNIGTEIIGVDTVREQDGLAMSSRNLLLTDEQRMAATALYRQLQVARNQFLAGAAINQIKKDVSRYFDRPGRPRLEYFEFVDRRTFRPADNNAPREYVSVCIAGYVGNIRLIDNISV